MIVQSKLIESRTKSQQVIDRLAGRRFTLLDSSVILWPEKKYRLLAPKKSHGRMFQVRDASGNVLYQERPKATEGFAGQECKYVNFDAYPSQFIPTIGEFEKKKAELQGGTIELWGVFDG